MDVLVERVAEVAPYLHEIGAALASRVMSGEGMDCVG